MDSAPHHGPWELVALPILVSISTGIVWPLAVKFDLIVHSRYLSAHRVFESLHCICIDSEWLGELL